MDREAFETLARYNAWMNRKLLDAASTLDDASRKEDRGLTFGVVPASIHGVFNHVLLGDRVWMGRFTGAELAPGEIGPGGVRSLGQELYADYDALRHARFAMDEALQRWVSALTPARLQAPLRRGKGPAMPLWCSVLHMFNHQTHHRGQVHAMMTRIGLQAPVTDLFLMPEEEEP